MGSRRQFREAGPPGEQALAVGALAIGDSRANAVGPVRITCEPDALRIDLFGVGRFAAGFAFATLADAVSFRVPYRAVRGMVRDGRSLLLSLDARAAAPYTRFALVRFSREPIATLIRAYRLRKLASWTSAMLPLPLTGAAVWALHKQQLTGPVGLAAMALIVGFLSYRLLQGMVAWLSWGGPISDRLQRAFEQTVSDRLGLELAPDLTAAPPRPAIDVAAEPAPVHPSQPMGAFLRPVAFAVVGSLAVGAAALAVTTVKRFGVAERVVLPVDDARTGFEEPVHALGVAGLADGATQHPSCRCGRVDSSLWRDGLPQVSVLVSPIAGEIDTVWMELEKTYPIRHADPERPEAVLDLAIVNNSTQKLKSLDFVLTFAFRDATGQRQNLRERGLHWPGNLGPGETVKWRVEAPGTEVKIETRYSAKLSAVTGAPADAFFPLAHARLPVVRLHGALMLAMWRDPRAVALASSAGELRGSAAIARSELLRTLSPLALCDVQPDDAGGFDGCVFNGTSELLRSITVESLDAEGGTLRHVVTDFFHAGEGLKVHVPLQATGRTVRVTP